MAREAALYRRLQPELESVREPLDPSSPAFRETAKREYAAQVATTQSLPESFRVSTPPAQVREQVEAFRALHPGRVEVGLNAIDGHRTYQVQIDQGAKSQVLLVDAAGNELGRGVARDGHVSWHWG